MSDDITVMILREIRDEVRHTRIDLAGRIDATNDRIGAMSDRLDAIHTSRSARLDAQFDQLRDETRAGFAAVRQLIGSTYGNLELSK